MPATVLLDIDPDKLFEQFTIQEVEETQKKLQHEIERKREELRTMVGWVLNIISHYIQLGFINNKKLEIHYYKPKWFIVDYNTVW